MTDALGTAVPAGWYPDPWGSTSQRWWDGTSWSANLYPQPETTTPDAPTVASSDRAGTAAREDEEYVPVAVRSTYEPASSYRTAAAPTVGSPYPSRRALRELAQSATAEDAVAATEDASTADPTIGREPVAEPSPAYAEATEASPQPEAALPPAWSDPEASVEAVQSPATAEPATPRAEVPVAVADAGTPVIAVAPAPPAASVRPAGTEDGWAASLSRWENVDTTTAPPDVLPIFGDAPPVSYSQRATHYQPLHGRTSPVWLIVFMPVLQALAMVGAILLFPGLASGHQVSASAPIDVMMPMLLAMRDWLLYTVVPLSIAFFVLTLVMGFQDRSRLRLLGHDQTASPWWIALNPLAYLIVRSVRVRQCTGRRGSGPLTTYVCLYIAPPIGIVIASAVSSALYGAIPA
jgi:hypothetical protein